LLISNEKKLSQSLTIFRYCMRISVRVTPRSFRNEVLPQADGSFRVYLTSTPTDGKANKQLIELLVDFFDVPKSCISLVSGQKGRKKIIEISN